MRGVGEIDGERERDERGTSTTTVEETDRAVGRGVVDGSVGGRLRRCRRTRVEVAGSRGWTITRTDGVDPHTTGCWTFTPPRTRP
jgi:hypothetical protein